MANSKSCHMNIITLFIKILSLPKLFWSKYLDAFKEFKILSYENHCILTNLFIDFLAPQHLKDSKKNTLKLITYDS